VQQKAGISRRQLGLKGEAATDNAGDLVKAIGRDENEQVSSRCAEMD